MSTVNYHVVTALVMHYAAHRGDSGELGRPWERVLESSDFNHIFFWSHDALVDYVIYIYVYSDNKLQLACILSTILIMRLLLACVHAAAASVTECCLLLQLRLGGGR